MDWRERIWGLETEESFEETRGVVGLVRGESVVELGVDWRASWEGWSCLVGSELDLMPLKAEVGTPGIESLTGLLNGDLKG